MTGRPPAVFSDCRRFRYVLWREFDLTNPTYLQVVGLNPSTADEVNDDPTIRRCIDFAKRWGFGALCMTNLFAFRATRPADMIAEPTPIGVLNDDWLLRIGEGAGIILAAWGAHGTHLGRGAQVAQLFEHDQIRLGIKTRLMCLGTTETGQPRHPLYVKADTKPVLYSLPAIV